MANIFRAAAGQLVLRKQRLAAEQLPEDYRDKISERISESPYSKNSTFRGPHYLAHDHHHIYFDEGSIPAENRRNPDRRCDPDLPLNVRCCCSLLTSYDKGWLVKLSARMREIGYHSVAGEVLLDKPIPNHRSELPLQKRGISIEEFRYIGLYLDGS